jgi:superfamily II DNA/RNA helicase
MPIFNHITTLIPFKPAMNTDPNNDTEAAIPVTFNSFAFYPSLQEGLDVLGFKTPTPIQQQAIPVVMAGKDLVGCAQTGTGKTAAFLLPVMDKILKGETKGINTLIIVPTRELAVQIDQAVEGLAYFTGISSIAIYGGGDGITWDQQRNALELGADIVIATPGRLLSLISSGKYSFHTLKHLVLDEADRMLDMGFYDDILRIVNMLPKQRQTLLFSATMPPRIRTLAEQILQNPESISLAISKPAEKISQWVYRIGENDKTTLALYILDKFKDDTIVIFGSTKEKVRRFFQILNSKKYNVATIHSDLEQAEREKTMNLFKNNQVRILVGTDIISRGIDVEGIGLVLNMDVPPDPEDYVHRIGRTARADTYGTAITFVTRDDERRWQRIEKLIGYAIPAGEIPEKLGVQAHMPSAEKTGGQRHGGPKGKGNGQGRDGSGNRPNKHRKPFHKNKPRTDQPPKG